MIKLFLTLCLALPYTAMSQIALPAGYKCVPSRNNEQENYFSNGTFRFRTDAGTRKASNQEDFINYFKNNYALAIRKTKDNLYWGLGMLDGRYVYVVLIPERLTSVIISTLHNNQLFSDQSDWLLQQVRKNKSLKKEFYFTDYTGLSCSGLSKPGIDSVK